MIKKIVKINTSKIPKFFQEKMPLLIYQEMNTNNKIELMISLVIN